MINPLLSVITINYNEAAGLAATIRSVLQQSYPHLEYIIIDGESTDGSVDLIRNHSGRLTYWVSEPDRGIYHAQNKGILQAKGDYLLFLNAGDLFASPDAVSHLMVHAPGADLLCGDIRFDTGREQFVHASPEKPGFRFFLDHSLPHPCTAIRKTLFDTLGLYNEAFRICADWVFFLDAVCRLNASYHHVPEVISLFKTGGLSSDLTLVQQEKDAYLNQAYQAFREEYRELIQSEQALKKAREKVGIFRHSKAMQWVFALLPRHYQTYLDI